MGVFAALKNKHVVIALLVTPVLAVLTWFAVGWFVGGDVLTPRAAESGQSYPLVEQSGCRYGGGVCRLRNEDFTLRIERADNGTDLHVVSAFPLDSLLLGLQSRGDAPPVAAMAVGVSGLEWQLPMAAAPSADDRLRVVANREGVSYFGEAGFAWLLPSDR